MSRLQNGASRAAGADRVANTCTAAGEALRTRSPSPVTAADRIKVSTASEVEWLDNVLELGWDLYLCSSPPFLLQSSVDRRMLDYTQAAFEGRADDARRISRSLDPVRAALRDTRPPEKPHAHQKFWQELLGQVGGTVRRPLLELTDAERAATREAFERCGLEVASG